MTRCCLFAMICLWPYVALCDVEATDAIPKNTKREVYFSPNGGCTEAIVNELSKAKETVLVQAYSFTSAPIAKALVDTHKRGVTVQIILDKSNRTAKYSSANFFANAGIPTYIDTHYAILHNKVIIIDSRVVITGSFNFTQGAEKRNAENLLILRNAKLAHQYTQDWKNKLSDLTPMKSNLEAQEFSKIPDDTTN